MAEGGPGASDRPDWLIEGFRHIWLPYAQMKSAPLPLPVVAATGAHLHLADGRVLVDGVSSWWTQCHGYNHPHLRAAIAAQLEKLSHVMLGGLANEPALRLATRLARLLPGDLDRVFFSESGSVAVEVAMKMAVQYWINRGESDRHRFLAFRFGYHGDTLGAMSVCDPEEGMHRRFGAYLPRQIVLDLPQDRETRAAFEQRLAASRHEIAAVIVEPLVQGAGGMKMHDAETLAFIRAACDRHGHLLILDEIMTGFGRLGTMFAAEEAGIVADIVTLSKALSGGALPLAATIARTHVFEAFLGEAAELALMHGPTYMGNPLACAAANASLDLFEREPRLLEVAAIEARLKDNLEPCRHLPGIRDVRVKGAIGVVQLERAGEAAFLRPRFVELGAWIRPFGDIVYLAPPFVIEPRDLDFLGDCLRRVIGEWSRRRA